MESFNEPETDISLLKDSLKHNYHSIINTLKPKELLNELFAENIIVQKEREHIVQEGGRKGATAQNELLMNYILKKSDITIRDFMVVMKKTQEKVYGEIIKTAEQIKNGEIKFYDKEIQEMREVLRSAYTEQKYHIIQAIPGEVLVLNLKDNKYIMPVDFTTQIKYCDEHLTERIAEDNITYDYIPKEFKSVEDVLMDLHHGKRLVACLGPTGNGKTVLIHRLVCEWMVQPVELNRLSTEFDLMIAIPLREVDTSSTLMEIIGSGSKGLKYIKPEMQETAEKCFNNKGEKILLLLDGLDEVHIPKESELFQILNGTLYPSIKVLFTARPEAAVLETLDENLTDFKINIYGTTTQGVYNYLMAVLTNPKGPNEEQVAEIVEECEQYMMDFPMLKVPLYLTLLAWLFDNEWVNYASFANFEIPKTTTMLMNACLCVILRIWMKRLNRSEQIKFDSSPIERHSSVPNDIKSKLVSFGHLCYEGLLNRKYEFNTEDMDDYLVYQEDVINSGLFGSSIKDAEITFFCRHKVFNEYLAAIYLSKMKFKETSFGNILAKSELDDNQTLLEIFSGQEIVFQFLCGMDPEYALQVIQRLQGRICVARAFHKPLNLHYESVLFTESTDKKLKHEIIHLILNDKVERRRNYNFYTSITRVHNLCIVFTPEQCASIIQNAYKFTVRNDGRNWTISNMAEATKEQVKKKAKTWSLLQCISKLKVKGTYDGNGSLNDCQNTSHLQFKPLDETLYLLLLQIAPFKGIKSLKGNSYISDIDLLCVLFPNVENVDIEHEERRTDCNTDLELYNLLKKKSVQNTTRKIHFEQADVKPIEYGNQIDLSNWLEPKTQLKRIKISSSKFFASNLPSIDNLLKQSSIEYLHLFQTDLLQHLKSVEFQPQWNNLRSVNMFHTNLDTPHEAGQDEEHTASGDIATLCRLLRCTPQLSELSLGCGVGNHTTISAQNVLIHSIAETLPELHTLALYQILNDVATHKTLYTVLPKFKHLHTLTLGYEHMSALNVQDIDENKDIGHCIKDPKYEPTRLLVEALALNPTISQLQLLYQYGAKKQTVEKLCAVMAAMKQDYPECNTVIVPKYWKGIFM